MESSAPSCWSCGASQDGGMTCAQCNALQPPRSDLNPFETLGFPVSVQLDEAELSAAHLRLTRSLHPDFFGNADPIEQAHSLAWSSRVNDAHRVLKNVMSRAGQVLAVHGRSIDTTEGGWRPSQAMLMEVFEINEGLEEIQRGSAGSTSQSVDEWDSTVQGWKDELMAGMVSHGESWETADSVEQQALLDALQEALARHAYVDNLRGRIERVKQTLAH